MLGQGGADLWPTKSRVVVQRGELHLVPSVVAAQDGMWVRDSASDRRKTVGESAPRFEPAAGSSAGVQCMHVHMHMPWCHVLVFPLLLCSVGW